MNYKEALTADIFELIGQSADELGLEAYVIGGYVRDFFLQRETPKDIDVVAVGSGIALAEKVASKLKGKPKVSVFKNFGTAMVKQEGVQLEFVGARKESYNRDSRKPVVENGTLKEDQMRRDFTINALALSLNKTTFGDLLDPFEGIKDIEREVLRTPLDPDTTYSDDPLRMMRAVRFATQLGFAIALPSLQAITDNKERINIISKERIVDELNKIMLTQKPSVGFALLHKTGLLDSILPELTALQGIEEIEGQRHKDNF